MLLAVSVLLFAAGPGHTGILFEEDFENLATGSDLIGQNGWVALSSGTSTSGLIIGERDGDKFFDGFQNGAGGFIYAFRTVNLFTGTGVDRVEVTWTANFGLGDYPDSGDARSHNFSVGLSNGDNNDYFNISVNTNPPEGEDDPIPSLGFDPRSLGADLEAVLVDEMFGQESGFKIFADRTTGEIGGALDPGNTGNFTTTFASQFIDPAVVQSFDHIRMFIDFRGGSASVSGEIDDIVITPEPAGLALIGVGALTLLIRTRHR